MLLNVQDTINQETIIHLGKKYIRNIKELYLN